MTNNSTRSRYFMVVAGCLLTVVLVPLVLQNAGGAAAEANRRRIVDMDADQRARLERNLKAFRELSDSDRERIERVHARVAAEPELADVLDRFNDWFKSLPLPQRFELRNASDSSTRMALIRRNIDEQKATSYAAFVPRQMPDRAGGPRPPFPQPGPGWESHQVNLAEFHAMLQVLHDNLPEPLQAKLDRESDSGSTLKQHVRLLELLAVRNREQAGQVPAFLTEQVMLAMIDQLSNPELRERLKSGRPDYRRLAFVSLMWGGLKLELENELSKRRPSPDDLQSVFAELDLEERDKLMQLPPEDAVRELQREFASRHYQRADPELNRVIQFLRQRDELLKRRMFPGRNGRLPPGGRPERNGSGIRQRGSATPQ